MLYNTRHFSDSFAKQLIGACQSDIKSLNSFNLCAMPGIGITFFLKALTQNSPDDYIFINSYEMEEFTREAFYSQLGAKLGLDENNQSKLSKISKALTQKAKSVDRLVIICNRLDRLGDILDQNFYDNLRFLRDSARDKITMIFVSSHPLIEISGRNVRDIVSLITKTVYFTGYSVDDLQEIFASRGTQDVDREALELSGGHHLLSQVLLNCQNLAKPLSDPMVELVIKDLYLGLSIKRQRLISSSVKKSSKPQDQYLLDAGFINQSGDKYEAFTPLLVGYIQSLGNQHLPLKEKRLFKVLLQHRGSIVSKEVVCDYVWSEDNGIVSDWALNALVYRLRRHDAFNSQRYTIESRKGEGYILFDHN
jgi:hypothetical protein